MAIVHFVNYKKPQTSDTMAFVLRCKSTSKVVSDPISRAKWTSMQDSSSAVNAVRSCICTDVRHLPPKRTSSSAADIRPRATANA